MATVVGGDYITYYTDLYKRAETLSLDFSTLSLIRTQ